MSDHRLLDAATGCLQSALAIGPEAFVMASVPGVAMPATTQLLVKICPDASTGGVRLTVSMLPVRDGTDPRSCGENG
ncbi:hypothetical protein A0U93_10185 [Neoasaia chiangmaiensis]|uniref:Uncharacterized protein n=1 Tax=Neoasaia chiangmaiensis TaxID=320497 RepID=A0A1U9KR26_9PROT|nr:hypothetical protein A0U93_10185 [Neoasaia chiangmaiensis]